MSMVRIVGIPKIGRAGDTGPAPLRTISIAPEIMTPKPPRVMSATTAPIIKIGLVKLIGANSTGATGEARFAPQRLQYLRPVLSVPQDGQNIN